MAMPMINETREVYPGATVTLLVPEGLAALFEGNPNLDQIIRIPTAHVHGMIAVMKIKDLLSPHSFDIGYILPPSFGAAASFKLGGVKERIGYIADGRRLLLTRPLPLPAPMNNQHRSVTYFDLLRRATQTDIEYVEPKIFLTEEDAHQALELLAARGVEAGTPYAVIAFQSVAESRRWGLEKYTELVKRLRKFHNLQTMLVGGEADQRAGETIVQDAAAGAINLAGKTTLRETAAIMAGAKVFIGNDSGPAHLAAAVGIPFVVLSGADDPKETSPIGKRKKLVYLAELECISCVKNKCSLKGDAYMRCMLDISVDMVEGEIIRLLGERPS
ncbi:MAG: glycosyltransferase family 9 protein [bacterium]|nr:glycosyltransferase family 9 protein [bacterium]